MRACALRVAMLVAALLAAGAPRAAAQGPTGALDRFSASEVATDDFHLSRPTTPGNLRVGGLLHLDYGLDPLVYETELGNPRSQLVSVVAHQVVGTAGLSLGLTDRGLLFVALPVTLLMDGAAADRVARFGVPAADGFGLGDLAVGGRVRLAGHDEDVASFALQATLTLPTADVPDEQSYRGDRFLTGHPELLLEVRPGLGLRLVANVGVRLRRSRASERGGLAFGSDLTFGLGAALPVWQSDGGDHLDLHVQVYGSSALDEFADRQRSDLEATGGLKLFLDHGLIVGLAGGPGLLRGIGSPDLRIIAMVGSVGGIPEIGTGLRRDEASSQDRDGDGIADRADACPDTREDVDGDADDDGCPDIDTDEDGIDDDADACPDLAGPAFRDGCPIDGSADDRCPGYAEDVDGFEDDDGCPDPDNDADGVLDVDDRCPVEPGLEEQAGCPPPDRDDDGVPDALDNCPDEVGSAANSGCQEVQRVALRDGRLELLEPVYFDTSSADIQARSFPLLENVARVLRTHPEAGAVTVEGHTDARGNHDRNVALSQARAESVVAFLLREGVDAERLTARGYGPDRPVLRNARTAEQHAQNRRVEFRLSPAAEGIEGGTR